MKNRHSIDYVFLTIASILAIIGLFVFFSAALGVLAKSEAKFYSILVSQAALGLVGGALALFGASRIPHTFWRKNATYLLIGSIILTTLVFLPGIGFSHGGARRWIHIFGISFQPVEFLKIAFVIYLAAWLSWVRKKIDNPLYGILPLVILLGIIGGVLIFQPDTKSIILMVGTGVGMLFLSGTPLKHLLMLTVGAVILFGMLAMSTPYLKERVKTFINPSTDPQGSSYQLRQALIAIGSGGIGGRGFGQGIQKFTYLPEPQGDSIFAVIGEEFGFVGSTIVILLYILFAMRGLWISRRVPDYFGGLLASGLVILITLQSFMNIASITGLFPLTGVPLVFMSQGGTSLLVSLGVVGIILSISRERKTR